MQRYAVSSTQPSEYDQHIQEPKFVDNDSGDDVPVMKQHRVAAGDGNKPTVAKESPVFSTIYNGAALELKRQIYFVNAFPTSTKSDALPRKAYDHGVMFARESGSFSCSDLQGVDRAFNGKWRALVRVPSKYPLSTAHNTWYS